MIRVLVATACLAPLLAACGGAGRARPVAIVEAVPPTPVPTGWHAIATDADQQRIAGADASLTRARSLVPRALRPKVAAEAELLDPAAAQTVPQLPPGPYHCRLIRFGGPARFRSFAPDFCYVTADKDALSFTKQTGSTLPSGWIYPDGDRKMVFLGTFRSAGDGKPMRHYGEDGGDDVAGVVERVSPFRWRLMLTRSPAGAQLDLYELVPVTPAVPGAKTAVPAK